MELLNQAYNQEKYLDFLAKKFTFNKFIQAIKTDNNEVNSFEQLGQIITADDKTLPVFEIHIKPNTKLAGNRVQLRHLIVKQIQTEDGALAVFVDKENAQWRFSFIAIEYKFTDGGFTQTQTASKRFTYIFGEGTNTRTAKERLNTLNKQSKLEDLKTAFAVEGLSQEFYSKLYQWYEKAQKQVIFPNDEQAKNDTETSLIRLLTRLLFIWFIKEKNLINEDLFDKDKLHSLIKYDQPNSFYKAILQNLFFATLNRPISERSFRTTTNGTANKTNYLATHIYRYQDYFTPPNKNSIIALFEQTPFLNGGLFECLDREATDKEKRDYDNNKTIRPVRSAIRIDGFSDRTDNELIFINQLFFNTENDLGLIDLFNQYQFTVEESTPLDVEVALDPELLGKVFENLLASYNPETGQQARKATGSFYTPREIVSYMVDESLKQHFKTHVNLADKQIDDLFIENENTLNEKQIKSVIVAIDSLKILDPAVGSGAYPMGILQRLVFILEKIDPENTYFKQQQINAAKQIPDEQSRNSAIQAIEQVFSTGNQRNAYGKKLYLIENAIYGVDIQAIAIQICKLRFFISLTIEQNPNKDKSDNYGIKALPNLETRFIVANSLLPLGEMPDTGQLGIFHTGISELQQQLAEVRHKYFSAKTLKTKRKYREDDRDLRKKMLAELKQQGGITKEVETSMRKIVHWDLYNQNATADWFDPEWQFGVKEGFDTVIGNPPYIRHESIKELKPQLKNHYRVFKGTADIYTYFYEKGFNLLSESGHLCYITSNKWMRAKYGEKLRGFFTHQTQLKQIIDFEGEQIFANATVDTNILLCGKTTNTSENFSYAKQLPDENSPLFTMPVTDLSENAYTLQPPEILALKKKIEQIGTPLKDWDISINYGIKTGYNDAFIIDNETKDALVVKDPKSAEILKPILRGRDIKAYEHHWAGLWLVATFPSVHLNIEDYPAIKRHLLSYGKEKLEQTGTSLPNGTKSRKKTPHAWFELQDTCAYHAEFEKEKIVYSIISSEPRFTFDDSRYYINDKCFLMTGNSNLYFLMAILNSKLSFWYLRQVGSLLGSGGFEFRKIYVEQLPIPQISKTEQQLFIKLVDQILTAKQNNKDTRVETKIDQIVCEIYNLTTDEIKIIERT